MGALAGWISIRSFPLHSTLVPQVHIILDSQLVPTRAQVANLRVTADPAYTKFKVEVLPPPPGGGGSGIASISLWDSKQSDKLRPIFSLMLRRSSGHHPLLAGALREWHAPAAAAAANAVACVSEVEPCIAACCALKTFSHAVCQPNCLPCLAGAGYLAEEDPKNRELMARQENGLQQLVRAHCHGAGCHQHGRPGGTPVCAWQWAFSWVTQSALPGPGVNAHAPPAMCRF